MPLDTLRSTESSDLPVSFECHFQPRFFMTEEVGNWLQSMQCVQQCDRVTLEDMNLATEG